MPADQAPAPTGWTAERLQAANAVARPNDARIAAAAVALLQPNDSAAAFAAWCDGFAGGTPGDPAP